MEKEKMLLNSMKLMNICTEFEGPRSILSVVIIRTGFGLNIIKLKTTVTLTFDRLISTFFEFI